MTNFGFEYWLFTFCLYCMIGWLQESAIESLYHKKPVNRGFLRGPYIPIYGVGGLLLLLIGEPFRDNPFLVFLIALLCCTTLEYFTGWIMETVFGKQFWDYSMMKYTYKNRISLLSSLFWGLMGLFVTYVVSVATMYILTHLPHQFIIITAVVVPLIMTIDFLMTAKKNVCKETIRHTFSLSNISARINVFSRIKARFYDDDQKSDYSNKDEFNDR